MDVEPGQSGTGLTRVITRIGDGGETLLAPGLRGPKDDPRAEACGAIDELTAMIGLLRTEPHVPADLAEELRGIQDDLFHMATSLFSAALGPDDFGVRMERIGAQLDRMNASLPRLANFIVPGGTHAGAVAHLARTVARRAERRAVTLSRCRHVNDGILPYLNRLSDYLFVAARHLNDSGRADDVWAPNGIR